MGSKRAAEGPIRVFGPGQDMAKNGREPEKGIEPLTYALRVGGTVRGPM